MKNSTAALERPAVRHSAAAPAITAEVKAAGELFMSVARDLLYVDDGTSDLPLRQLRVCTALFEGPRSMSQLGRELRVSLSAMTQIADRLELAGFVTRIADGEDRRVRCLQLTARGERAMGVRQELRLARVAEILSRLTADERDQLTICFETLQRSCRVQQSPPA